MEWEAGDWGLGTGRVIQLDAGWIIPGSMGFALARSGVFGDELYYEGLINYP